MPRLILPRRQESRSRSFTAIVQEQISKLASCEPPVVKMRSTSRLLATVKSASKYLEPNVPTGLTGLSTHPSPRPALIYTYKQTLKKLNQLPSSSVYRQSTEALTKHRLAIIEATKPDGYDAWLGRVHKQIDANPEAYSRFRASDGSLQSEKAYAEKVEVWDGELTRKNAYQEGSNDLSEAEAKSNAVKEESDRVDKEAASGVAPAVEDLEKEPPLTKVQYVSPIRHITSH